MRRGADDLERIARRVASMLRARRPPGVDRSDLWQDAWLAALIVDQQIDRDVDEGYLVIAVRNRVIDRWRQTGPLTQQQTRVNARNGEDVYRPAVSLDALIPTMRAGVHDTGFDRVDDIVSAQQDATAVWALLDERERYVLHALYVRGLPLRDIGTELGCTESNVCHITKRAARRVREATRRATG